MIYLSRYRISTAFFQNVGNIIKHLHLQVLFRTSRFGGFPFASIRRFPLGSSSRHYSLCPGPFTELLLASRRRALNPDATHLHCNIRRPPPPIPSTQSLCRPVPTATYPCPPHRTPPADVCRGSAKMALITAQPGSQPTRRAAKQPTSLGDGAMSGQWS